MKVLILIFFILTSPFVFSQEGNSDFDDEYVDGLYPEEPDEESPRRAQVQDQNPVQVECVCPQNEVQAEEEPQTSVFAPGTVFNVTPEPEVPLAPAPEKQEEESIPGQLKEMPPGYSNDTYVPAGVMPQKEETE